MSILSFPLLTRREFMRRMAALGGGVALASSIRGFAATENPRAPLHVVIVGAGMAGLCAAYELEQRGHRVTLLEADPAHAGGRVRTLRFNDGLYGEAGAMRIPTVHELTRHYIREFGLPLRRFVKSNKDAYYFARGRRERIADEAKLKQLYHLTDAEKVRSSDELWEATVVKALLSLSESQKKELLADSFNSEALRRLDQLSLQQLCEGENLSAEALEFLAVTQGQESELATAATEFVREELLKVWALEFDEIIGGTDRLATAFVQRLRSKPQMGCEVLRFGQSEKTASVIYRVWGVERRVEGDYVLCTVPYPVLSRLHFAPALSAAKQRAIRELNYDSSTKVLAIAKRRFWEEDDKIFGGPSYTDLPTGTTVYPADNAEAKDPRVSRRPSVFLASYTWGQTARRLASLAHAERAATVLRHLSQLHPQLREPGMVLKTASWSWDNHRYSGGAFAWFMPGQHSALHRHIVTPEGRIYFAGEHASLSHTWIQGALESARRAVTEILQAAPRS